MKRIKQILIIVLLLQLNINYAQAILGCDDAPLEDEQIDESFFSHAMSRSPQDTEKYVFNMFFHIIRNDNGDSVPTNEDTTLEAIAMLNRTYNQYDIYFKYLGYDYLDNSDFVDVTSTEFYNDLNNTTQAKPNAFNVYIASTVNGGNNAGKGRFHNTFSVFDDDYFISASLPHEIGHNFYLLHTRQNWNTSNCEHISGDNCIDHGDKVCATPASHLLHKIINGVRHNYVERTGVSGSYTFTYNNFDNLTDCEGTLFQNVGFTNFMDSNEWSINNYYHNLRNHFIEGQAVRMRETIESSLYHSNFDAAKTTLSSLFMPYKDELVLVDPAVTVSITETKDGIETCKIRYAEHYYHYYQPGFDYEFYDSSSVLDHANSFDELYSIVDDGFIRGIKILQIDSNDIEAGAFYPGVDTNGVVPNINMCYKPSKKCTLDPFLRGKVITTPILGSSNISIKDLDTQEAIDPDLEQNLENNKYHIIQKTTVSGTNTQKTIYKNGN